MIINLQPDMEAVGDASNVRQAITEFRHHHPDVTLMDLKLGTESGVDAIRAIRREEPDARVIALTMYENVEAIREALAAGAATYVSKNTPGQALLDVIRRVHAGERPMAPGIKAQLDQYHQRPSLTRREHEVIELVSRGLRNKQIATSLDISEETVEVHLRNIFLKLNVNDRTAAMRAAILHGIIRIE